MDIILALLPALGWGIQPLILKKIGGTPFNQLLGTGIGAVIMGLISLVVLNAQPISTGTFLIAMGSGMFWVLGQFGQYKALDMIGVSRTMPITTGLQLVGAAVLSVILFGEWPGVTAKIIGLVAILCMIGGAYMTSISSNEGPDDGGATYRGFIVLLMTSIGYWLYSIAPRLANTDGINMFFPQMLGVGLGAFIANLIVSRSSFTTPESYKSGVVGLIFGSASLAYILSAQANGVATAFTITQLNVVVATLGGIYILKEQKTPMEFKFTMIGLALIVAGSIMTAFI